MDHTIISQYYTFINHFYRDILKDHPDNTILKHLLYAHDKVLEEYIEEESINKRENLEIISSIINDLIYNKKYKCIKHYKCIEYNNER